MRFDKADNLKRFMGMITSAFIKAPSRDKEMH